MSGNSLTASIHQINAMLSGGPLPTARSFCGARTPNQLLVRNSADQSQDMIDIDLVPDRVVPLPSQPPNFEDLSLDAVYMQLEGFGQSFALPQLPVFAPNA